MVEQKILRLKVTGKYLSVDSSIRPDQNIAKQQTETSKEMPFSNQPSHFSPAYLKVKTKTVNINMVWKRLD